jgi:hypothetical protein
VKIVRWKEVDYYLVCSNTADRGKNLYILLNK